MMIKYSISNGLAGQFVHTAVKLGASGFRAGRATTAIGYSSDLESLRRGRMNFPNRSIELDCMRLRMRLDTVISAAQTKQDVANTRLTITVTYGKHCHIDLYC